jgi:hypothetical protein
MSFKRLGHDLETLDSFPGSSQGGEHPTNSGHGFSLGLVVLGVAMDASYLLHALERLVVPPGCPEQPSEFVESNRLRCCIA